MALLEAFTPRAALDAIAAGGVTFVPLVPVMYESLTGLDGDWTSVRRCISAGSPLDPALARRFHEQDRPEDPHVLRRERVRRHRLRSYRRPAPPRGSVGTPLDGVRIDLTGGRTRARASDVGVARSPASRRGRALGARRELRDRGSGEARRGRTARPHGTGQGRHQRRGTQGRAGRDRSVPARRSTASPRRSSLGVPDPVRGEAIGALVVAPALDESACRAWCRESLPPGRRRASSRSCPRSHATDAASSPARRSARSSRRSTESRSLRLGGLRGGEDRVDDRVDVLEDAHRAGRIADRDAEALLELGEERDGVDRVETEALGSEERRVVADGSGSRRSIRVSTRRLLMLARSSSRVWLRWASVRIVRRFRLVGRRKPSTEARGCDGPASASGGPAGRRPARSGRRTWTAGAVRAACAAGRRRSARARRPRTLRRGRP